MTLQTSRDIRRDAVRAAVSALGAMLIVFVAGGVNRAHADDVLEAARVGQPMTLDGDMADWDGIAGITVPLEGRGGVDAVELRAAVHGDTIYVLAVWDDPTENVQHKPYRWNETTQAYEKILELEDRFALSLRISGEFTANKIDGSVFVADVWHWKASRSNPAGIAHDKIWRTSTEPFEKAREWKTDNGAVVYLARLSDEGSRLYKPMKSDVNVGDQMPGYEVNLSPEGSIADVRAKGVWRNGRWVLELARKLDTGHPDDAVIPANGTIEIAVAAFNGVDGRKHSVSEVLMLKTMR